LEKAAEFHPDLIITDLVMPVMDGFEMIRNIRASQLQDVVVIARFVRIQVRDLTRGEFPVI
jgi:CheY-like chemotaxis protein